MSLFNNRTKVKIKGTLKLLQSFMDSTAIFDQQHNDGQQFHLTFPLKMLILSFQYRTANCSITDIHRSLNNNPIPITASYDIRHYKVISNFPRECHC